jgi:hypothetical protein
MSGWSASKSRREVVASRLITPVARWTFGSGAPHLGGGRVVLGNSADCGLTMSRAICAFDAGLDGLSSSQICVLSLTHQPLGFLASFLAVGPRRHIDRVDPCLCLGVAAELCPKHIAELREDTPEMIRGTKMRNLSHLNPQYYTDAFIETATGVPTPRRRNLTLCLGDDTRTLITENGGFRVGYDPREIVESRGKPVLESSEADLPEILDIVKSIRFVPQQP